MESANRKTFARGKWLAWSLGVLVVIFAVAATIWLSRPGVSDPWYTGKRLSHYVEVLPATLAMTNGYSQGWVWGPDLGPMSAEERNAYLDQLHRANEEADKAIGVVGEKCLPLLIHWLGHREPASERMWEKVYPRVIPLLQRVGMKSRLGLPGLSRTERRRWQAVTALMKLRESGVDLKPLLPRMKVLVQDQDSEVRRAARFMLREIDSEALDQLDKAGPNLTGRTQP